MGEIFLSDRMEYPSAKSALWCLLRRRPFDLWSCHAGAGTEPHRRTLYFGSFLRSIGRSSLGAADADSFFQGTVSDHGYGSLRRFGGLCLCLQHGEDRRRRKNSAHDAASFRNGSQCSDERHHEPSHLSGQESGEHFGRWEAWRRLSGIPCGFPRWACCLAVSASHGKAAPSTS